MRFLFFLAFIFLFNRATLAQDSLAIRHKPQHALKFSPLHLWGFYPTLQFAYEVSLTQRLGFQVDAGYVLNAYSNTNSDFQDKRGTKLKVEGRYYFESLPNSPDGFYVSIEPYLNLVNFDRTGSVNECFDGTCQNMFVRYFTSKVKYRENGVSCKVGYLIFFDENILLDINAGWSLRNIRYYGNEGTTSDMIEFFSFEPNEEDRVVLTPTLGIRVGYRFR